MKGQTGERTRTMPLRRLFRLRDWAVLTISLGLLTACAKDVYLGSTEPATIEGYEYEREIKVYSDSEPPSTAYRVLSVIPGVDLLAFIARTAITESEKTLVSRTVYTEALRISRIDGEAVALTAQKVEVPFGEHTIEVKYCRYEELRSACSRGVELSFRAEPGVSYRLRRTSEFQVELWSSKAVGVVVRSEARAVVAQDEEDCVRKRKFDIETRARNWPNTRAEAGRLLSEVKPYCRSLVRGALSAAE